MARREGEDTIFGIVGHRVEFVRSQLDLGGIFHGVVLKGGDSGAGAMLVLVSDFVKTLGQIDFLGLVSFPLLPLRRLIVPSL